MAEAFTQTCICSQAFSDIGAFTHHEKGCAKGKKRLLDALTKAKDVYQAKKGQTGGYQLKRAIGWHCKQLSDSFWWKQSFWTSSPRATLIRFRFHAWTYIFLLIMMSDKTYSHRWCHLHSSNQMMKYPWHSEGRDELIADYHCDFKISSRNC